MKLQQARKSHRCTLCGREIKKGQNYWRAYSEQEDRKEHSNCTQAEKDGAKLLPEDFEINRSKYK